MEDVNRYMESKEIQKMFDTIAKSYDILNHGLSLGNDILWRRKLIRSMHLPRDAKILDIACGTGDVLFECANILGNGTDLYGMDFSLNMLSRAKRKSIRKKKNIQWILGDAFYPPFPQNYFDGITIAFGIRNIMDRQKVLQVFREHLKPEGVVGVLELSTPELPFISDLYLLYFRQILPWLGGMVSKNQGAYTYLPASVSLFPGPLEFAKTMEEAGFENVRHISLSFGIATIFIGSKPPSAMS